MSNKVLITNLICNMIENIVMIAGIVYSAIYFKRFSLLWFLLMPLVSKITVRSIRDDEEESTE